MPVWYRTLKEGLELVEVSGLGISFAPHIFDRREYRIFKDLKRKGSQGEV